jgi:hypothetical protein
MFLYPSGAKVLDEGVVDANLLWLQNYPNILKSFETALTIYLRKDESQYRNLLDNLRFSIEQLLKNVLGNEKSLEKQDVLPYLASRGLHSHIVGMFHDLLFDGFAKYQNDAVKHGEKYTAQEIEFMIYLTGTFMRFIIQVSKP